MPINQDHRLLFVHIPKTGGTSVEECLGMRGPWKEEDLDSCFGLIQSLPLLRYAFGSNFLQHLTLKELFELLGDDLLGLTPFAVLRDPWTRLLSSFRRKDPDLCSLYHYKCHRDLHDLSLEEYVELASWLDHPHLRPQWKFLCTTAGSAQILVSGCFGKNAWPSWSRGCRSVWGPRYSCHQAMSVCPPQASLRWILASLRS